MFAFVSLNYWTSNFCRNILSLIIHVVFRSWNLDICSKANLRRDIYLTCIEQVFDL